MTRSAAPRCSTTSRSSRPMRRAGNRSRTSRSTRSVPPPRYRIRGEPQAGQRVAERGRPAAVVAAERHPCLVIDERPLAVGAGLDVAAVAAHDDRGRPAPVEDEDRLLAGRRVERAERRRERARQQPALPRRELGTQVDDLDVRAARRPPAPAGRPGRSAPVRARPTLSTAGVADPRTTAAPASRPSRIATSRAWSRGVRSLLYAASCSSSTMTRPTSASGASDREPRPDDDVDVAGPDPAPLVGPLALAEARVDERDPHVEVGPKPVDQRQRQGDLRDEHEGRPARLERRDDRLDVDRGLAGAGDAVEKQRPRVARCDGGLDAPDGFGLRRRQVAARRAGHRGARPAGRERASRTLADVGLGQTAADQARAPRHCRTGPTGPRRQLAGDLDAQRPEDGLLLRPEPRSARRFAGADGAAAARPVSVSRDPSFVSRPCTGAEERPLERSPSSAASARNRRSDPARPSGPARSRTGRGPFSSWPSRSASTASSTSSAVRGPRGPARARPRARAVRAGPAEASPG